jgi:DNA-binding transcriptional LysR family regulator
MLDQLTSLKVFCEVVDANSFSAAADRLSMSAPMVSKHVAQLEKSLGARLLHRTSRRLSLTEAGAVYHEQCRAALDSLQVAEASIGHSTQTPRGQLKLSAPVWCANRRFAEILCAYREKYPEVMVDIRLENRKVDLAAEGFDLALRATREPSANLIARPLCPVPFLLVASPAYLKRQGTPQVPEDLAQLGLIAPSYLNIEGMEIQGPGGKARVRSTVVMKSDDTTLSYHAVHSGLGFAYLPEWLVADDVAAGQLVHVLPQHSAPCPTLFAVYTSRQYLLPKLRSFIDFLGDALKHQALRST